MALNLIDSPTFLEKRILSYLEQEKLNKDKNIVKIVDILINDEVVSSEVVKKHIKFLKLEKIESEDNFVTLILAFLLADIENYTESLNLFHEFIQLESNNSISKDIQQFIILIKVSELNDFSNIGQDSITLVEGISTKENIVNLLWRLSGMINAKDNLDLYQNIIDKAEELYPNECRIGSYQGWIYREQKQIDLAITEYLNTMQALKHEIDNQNFNFELASVYLSLAECCLLLPSPDVLIAIEYCNLALKHDSETEEFSIEDMILLTHAKAILLLPGRDEERLLSATTDVYNILENDPDNVEAIDIYNQLLSKF